MARVLSVTPDKKRADWRRVTLLDGDKVAETICFGTQPDQLKLGEDLPAGWTVEAGKYGPVLRYPGATGGGGGRMQASWRNTEEGFKYEQMKMDKRTAVMQAVAMFAVPGAGDEFTLEDLMNKFYDWLRKE